MNLYFKSLDTCNLNDVFHEYSEICNDIRENVKKWLIEINIFPSRIIVSPLRHQYDKHVILFYSVKNSGSDKNIDKYEQLNKSYPEIQERLSQYLKNKYRSMPDWPDMIVWELSYDVVRDGSTINHKTKYVDGHIYYKCKVIPDFESKNITWSGGNINYYSEMFKYFEFIQESEYHNAVGKIK